MIPTHARVVRLVAPRQLAWIEEPLPREPGPGELTCRTVVSAISPGTEIAAWRGARPLRDIPAFPRVVGYCNVAEVLQVGVGVNGYAVGDRVLSFGSHRSHLVLQEKDVLLRLPQGASAELTSLTYLFHLGYNAVLRASVQVGHRVAVIGLGVLGLAAVAIGRMAGADVLAVSDHAHPSQVARHFGAGQVVARAQTTDFEQWADVVVTTTNGWEDWELALRLAAPMGRLAVLGFPGRDSVPGDFNPLDSRYFYQKQLRLEAVGMSPEANDSRGFLRFNERENLKFLHGRIVDGTLPARELISGSYPAPHLREAYEALLDRRNNPLTFVLVWA